MDNPRQIFNVSITLDHIQCINEGDGPGLAEPYLWTLFFKIDGSTVQFAVGSTPEMPFLLGLQGSVTIDRRNGRHHNLRNTDDDPVDSGEDVAIPPSLGHWDTELIPISITAEASSFVKDMVDLPGTVGVICILMEEDNLTDSSVVAGYDAFCSTFEAKMNERIQSMTAAFLQNTTTPEGEAENKEFTEGLNKTISEAVESAIKDNLNILEKTLNFLAGSDDTLGSGSFIFDSDDFIGQNQLNLEATWKEGVNIGGGAYSPLVVVPFIIRDFFVGGPGNFITSGGEWKIWGSITANPVPLPVQVIPKLGVIYTISHIIPAILPAGVGPGMGGRPASGGDLMWARHTGRENGSFRWAGPMKKVGIGWGEMTHVFSDGDGIIYAITPVIPASPPIGIGPGMGGHPASGGDLMWGRHLGWNDGTFRWAGDLKKVGIGWGEMDHVFSDGNGISYAITHFEPATLATGIGPGMGSQPASGGDLMWGRHLGREDGTFRWEGLKKVGNGWGELTHVFSGGDGIIYAITNFKPATLATGIGPGMEGQPASGGDLMWARHIGREDGSFRWDGDMKKVGVGWGEMAHVFSGGDGIIYAITPRIPATLPTGIGPGMGGRPASGGDLMCARHIGREDGSFRWDGPLKKVGHGWDVRKAFSAEV